MPEPIIGPRNISNSQLSHRCQLALKFHRQRIPWPYRGISLLYGTGIHAGLEEWHRTRNLDQAIKVADRALVAEVIKDPPVRWDIKKGPAHKAAIPDLITAQGMLRQHLTAWDALRKDWQGRVLDLEVTVWVPLTKVTPPWKLQARIDLVVEEDGKKVIYDWKSSGKPWTTEKLMEHRSQAWLYLGAEWHRTRVAPDLFRFVTFVKGTDKIEFHDIPFSAPDINKYLEGIVRPVIGTIEAGAYAANLDWWGHDEKYCEFFAHCAFGSGTAT